jgi:hypothetical protein
MHHAMEIYIGGMAIKLHAFYTLEVSGQLHTLAKLLLGKGLVGSHSAWTWWQRKNSVTLSGTEPQSPVTYITYEMNCELYRFFYPL